MRIDSPIMSNAVVTGSFSGSFIGDGTNLSGIQASSVAANSVTLGTDTTGNYVATLGSGTGVTIGSNTGEGSNPTITVDYGSTANTAVQGNTSLSFAGTSNEISIDGGSSITLGSGGTVTIGLADTITGDRTFSNNVVISGNLTVSGTTTSVNSNTVNIGDNVLVLNSDEAGTPSQNGGIEIERGTSTNSTLLWDEGNDYWVAGLSGSEERIVIGAGNTSITTLGTITTGSWNGTAINDAYISSATAWNAKLDSAGTIATDDYAKFDVNGDLVGRSYTEVKTDLSLNNVENTALSTYTGNGGALDNQYITNGAGYITSFDITTQTDPKYLRSDATDTATGVITFSNSTASTSTTTGAVKVTGGVGIGGALNVGGDVVAYASSDERLKTNITPIENATEKLKQIGGYSFDWLAVEGVQENRGHDIGVLAQEVEKIAPEIVTTRENGYKAVRYEKLIAILIQSNKELLKRIEVLEERL